MVKVYILLPVHNRREITIRFIDCLRFQSHQNFHLVLIDDGSTDGTEEMVRERIHSLTVLKGAGDWWWAGSLEEGVNWLRAHSPKQSDVILMINDDLTFDKLFLAKGVEFLDRNPDALLLARFLDVDTNEVVETGVKADFSKLCFEEAKNQEDINCLSTRGLFLKWSALQQIGGFYRSILPHYHSDYEFTIRAKRKGFSLKTDSEIYVTPDLVATGLKEISNVSLGRLVTSLFSKKYVNNPVYWTSFILLASPARWVPINITRVWLRAIRVVLRNRKMGHSK